MLAERVDLPKYRNVPPPCNCYSLEERPIIPALKNRIRVGWRLISFKWGFDPGFRNEQGQTKGHGKGFDLVWVGAEDAGRRNKQIASDCAIDRQAKISCHSRFHNVAQRSRFERGANEIGILINRQENDSSLGPALSQFNGSLDAT